MSRPINQMRVRSAYKRYTTSAGFFLAVATLCAPTTAKSLADRDTAKLCSPHVACKDWNVGSFATESGSRRYFLVSRSTDITLRSLALRISSDYVGSDTVNSTQTFDIGFFLWPDLSGPLAKKNRQYSSCIQGCGGRTSIVVSYDWKGEEPLPDRAFKNFVTGNVVPTTLEKHLSELGFDDVEANINPEAIKYRMDETGYFAKAKGGQAAVVALCSNSTPILVCQGYGVSSLVPGLSISAVFERKDLPEWLNLQKRILDELAAGVVAKLD